MALRIEEPEVVGASRASLVEPVERGSVVGADRAHEDGRAVEQGHGPRWRGGGWVSDDLDHVPIIEQRAGHA